MVNIDYRITMIHIYHISIMDHDQPFRKPQTIKHDQQ